MHAEITTMSTNSLSQLYEKVRNITRETREAEGLASFPGKERWVSIKSVIPDISDPSSVWIEHPKRAACQHTHQADLGVSEEAHFMYKIVTIPHSEFAPSISKCLQRAFNVGQLEASGRSVCDEFIKIYGNVFDLRYAIGEEDQLKLASALSDQSIQAIVEVMDFMIFQALYQ